MEKDIIATKTNIIVKAFQNAGISLDLQIAPEKEKQIFQIMLEAMDEFYNAAIERTEELAKTHASILEKYIEELVALKIPANETTK